MQLVGATKGFIRRPFIWQSVKLGMIGALLAMIAMGLVLYYLHNSFPDFGLIDDPILLISIFAGVFLLGILLTLFSTFLATQRFLNLQTDELYY